MACQQIFQDNGTILDISMYIVRVGSFYGVFKVYFSYGSHDIDLNLFMLNDLVAVHGPYNIECVVKHYYTDS